jgi:nondiscriminating glutamyl-tRNA synthetase
VGGARTALFNFLFARKNHGKFILRIEDTDQARSTEASLQMLLEDLIWLGLEWDEGPILRDSRNKEGVGAKDKSSKEKGEFGPYRQSQRLAIYKKHAEQLLAEGKAYYCFLTDEEIKSQKEKKEARGLPPHIESPYADWSLEQARAELARGRLATVRFRTSHLKRDFVFKDLVRGEVVFPSDMVGDFVLLRGDGMPVYNFCNVVDDGLMQISHVLRAEEHLPNTLRQLMIYEALGWLPPELGHLSLILDEDRKKLSKRKGATSCHEFKEEGYLPEALNNFNALLGWSHPEGKEILSMSEMIEKFSLERVNPAGAVFDAVKLKWMNATHLRAKPDQELWELIEPFLSTELKRSLPPQPEWRRQALSVFRSAMETLRDGEKYLKLFLDENFNLSDEAKSFMENSTASPIDSIRACMPPTSPSSVRAGMLPTSPPSAIQVIQAWLKALAQMADRERLSSEEAAKCLDEVKAVTGARGKDLFMPIRIACMGEAQGFDIKTLVPLFSRSSLMLRAQAVLDRYGKF